MNNSDIISMLVGVSFFCILSFGITAGIIKYINKVYKNNKKIEKGQYLYCLLIMYIVFLAVVTIAFRDSGTERVCLSLFSSYREAWNKVSYIEWRNIILNILMFIPFSMIVMAVINLNIKSISKYGCLISAGLGLILTVVIELIQMQTGRGTFEIDDIINNFFGTISGIFFFCIIVNIKQKRKHWIRHCILYGWPVYLMITVCAILLIRYNSQQYGNMDIAYSRVINMNNIKFESNIDVNQSNIQEAKVYRTQKKSEEEIINMAESMYKNINTNIDMSMNEVYQDFVAFHDTSNRYLLNIYRIGGRYRLTDSEIFSCDEITENVSEDKARKALNKLKIDVSDKAEYNSSGAECTFTFKQAIDGEKMIDGVMSCVYYKDDTIKEIYSDIVECSEYKKEQIISLSDAIEKIQNGYFNLDNYNQSLYEIVLNEYKISYYLDSKGFYEPVYIFEGTMNGEQAQITIPAIH